VREDRVADLTDERIVADLALFGTRRLDDLLLPIDVVEREAAHFGRSKAVDREQQQHRAIAQPPRRVAAVRLHQLLHLRPRRPLTVHDRGGLCRDECRRLTVLRVLPRISARPRQFSSWITVVI
jgi:hypothetical protein